MYRKTYVEIDTKILKDNVEEIIKNYSDYKYYIGVVKANAYGHGSYIVNSLIEGGVNYLAVSSLEEAIDIRKYNKDIPILCLEVIGVDYIKEIEENNISITVESLEYAKELAKIKLSKTLKVHLKLDTGMNRLGFKDKKLLNNAVNEMKKNSSIFIEGIYTHFATSGVNDKYYDNQLDKFKELTEEINLREILIVHIDRSTTLVHHYKKDFTNGVRLGICMYGFNQSINNPSGLRRLKRNWMLKRFNISESILKNDLKLETAFSLYSEVMSIRKVNAGEFVGYGASYKAKEPLFIATLPIGYFDGMKKEMKYVSINNHLYEIVGDICMDMTTVKVDKNVKVHDKVEIFGNNISINKVSSLANTNAYHVLTSITSRVPRIYK